MCYCQYNFSVSIFHFTAFILFHLKAKSVPLPNRTSRPLQLNWPCKDQASMEAASHAVISSEAVNGPERMTKTKVRCT